MTLAPSVRRPLIAALLLCSALLLAAPTLADSGRSHAGRSHAGRSHAHRGAGRRDAGSGTIEEWVRTDSRRARGDVAARRIALSWGPTRLRFRRGVATSGWTHVVVTWDAATVRLAIDGIVDETDHLGAPAYASASHRLSVGRRDRTVVRDRRRGHRSLSTAEIARRFDAGARRHGLRPLTAAATTRPTARRRALAHAAAAPANTVLPAITGTAKDGQTLTSTTGTWTGSPTSYARAWQRCNASGASCVAISGATATTYVLTSADVGSTIRVKVTATSSGGSGNATSNQTAAVVAAAPVNTALPAITGTAKDGQTLTSTTGTWSGTTPTYARQWKRCDSAGANCVAISGATATTYVLTSTDVGAKIVVAVTATNAAGNATATSAATAAVTAAAPTNTAAPAITGTVKEGQLLTASTGTWSGSATITYTYQWQSCVGSTCTAISGATGSTYRLAAAQVGKTVKVAVTATNAAGNATATSVATATVTTGPPVSTAAPSVTGTLTDGQTLTAANGTWAGTATITYARQWKRCDSAGANCVAISGATGTTYTLTSADVNARMVVTVTATNSAGNASASSAATGQVAGIPPTYTTLATISGTAIDGHTLTSSTGTWSGTTPITYARQWKRCDGAGANCVAISGATATTYALGSADVGATIRVTVTASNAAGSFALTTAQTATVGGLAPTNTTAPTLTGTAKDGQTLAVSTGTWTGTTPLSYAYTWRRCDVSGAACSTIPGVTGTTYTLVGDDIGGKVKVTVTATNSVGSASVDTATTATVVAAAPIVGTAPAVSGTAKEGQVLTVSDGTWTGTAPIAYGYQWQSCVSSTCTPISGVAGSNYRLTAADVGKTIKAMVTATNAVGSSSSTTPATATITTGPPVDVTAPSIAGSTVDGQTLTAANGSWAGTATISYARQWKRCDATGSACTAVSGATGATYVLTAADVGATLRVAITAANGVGSTSADSPPTAPITAGTPVNTVVPTISGTAAAGQTLSSTTGTWVGTAPITYTRQWKRCTAGGSCVAVSGATGASYAVTSADAGYRLKLAVTASNGGGSVAAESAPTSAVPGTAPASLTAPTISGTAADGQTLTTTAGTWSGSTPLSISYQWRRCTAAGSGCTPITSATSASYGITSTDVGKTIKVSVTAVNGVGSATVDTTTTAAVTGAAPLNTALPTISGTALAGRTLTGATGMWTGSAPVSYSLQWQRCDATGASCASIAGATHAGYQASGADVGGTLRFTVVATNALASVAATSAATGVVGGAAPVNTQLPAIDGTVADGRQLTAELGTWTGTAPMNYSRQWQRCDVAGDDCESIDGAMSTEYTPSVDDVGSTLRVVVTAWNAVSQASAASAASAIVVESLPTVVEPLQIYSDLREGQSVAVYTGVWAGTQPLTVTVHWARCTSPTACTSIAAWDGIGFMNLDAADVGKRIKATVTATNSVGSVDYTFPLTDVVGVGPPTVLGTPNFTGQPREGLTLSRSWTGTFGGTAPITITHQWQRCGGAVWSCDPIPGATGSSYAVTAADVGSNIRLASIGTNAQGSIEADSSMSGTVLPTAPINTAVPTVAGTARDGATLTATLGTWTSAVTPDYAYAWKRCDATGHVCARIPQATLDHYRLTSDDVGATVRVVVTATNAGGNAGGVSAATAVVASAAPQNTAPPSINGEPADTETLTIDPGTWSGTRPQTTTYAWQRCDAGGASCAALSGATANSYTLAPADVGTTLRAVVTATNANGSASATTATRGPIVALAPRTGGSAVIHGRPLVGETLSLASPTWEGSATITHTYAWKRCDADGQSCVAISGATTKDHVLVAADDGHRLVATDTATNATGTATVASAPTAAVGDPAVAALELGFDDGHGTIAQDATANDDDATLTGTRWVGGRHGGAASFDGESAHATAPTTAALDGAGLSIEGWVRLRETGQPQVVAERAGGGHDVTLLAADLDGHAALVVDGVTVTGPVLTAGRWTHLAGSAGPDGLRLFVDGAQVATTTSAPSALPIGAALALGADAGHDRPLDGELDDVRAYAAPLTSYQVQADRVRPVADHGPVGAYPLDEGEGTIAHDSSGRGGDAPLQGTTWEAAESDRAAAIFDGITGMLTTPESDALSLDGAFTAEAAVKPQTVATTQVLLQQAGRDGADGYTLYASDATGHVRAVIGATVLTGPILALEDWSSVALTDDGAEAKLFVDGDVVASAAVAAAPRAQGILRAAAPGDRLDQRLTGGVDDIRVYGRALSDDEVGGDAATPVAEDAPGPRITLSGTLVDDPQIRFGDVASLTAIADESGDDGAWTPGITLVSVYLGDDLLAQNEGSCDAGGCRLSATGRIDVNPPAWDYDGTHANPYADGDYELRVVATDAGGESATTTLPITINVHNLPPANDGLYVHSSYGVTGPISELSWNANPDGDVPQYMVRYLDNTFNQWELYPQFANDPPVTKPFLSVHDGLWQGHPYTYYVMSWMSQWVVTSPGYEQGVTVMMPSGDDIVPKPTTLSGEAVGGRVTLTWPQTQRTDDPVQAVDGYLVFRDDADGDPERLTPAPVDGPTFVDADAPEDADLHYEVRAVVGHQMSAATTASVHTNESSSGTPAGSEHPDPTLELSGAAVVDTSVLASGSRTLGLTATAKDGASISAVAVKVDSITKHVSAACSTANCSVTDTYDFVHDELSEGSHTIKVIATDSLGGSTTRRFPMVTDAGPPPAVTGVHTKVTRDGIHVAWDDLGLRDVTQYEVFRSASEDGSYTSLTTDPVGDVAYTDATAPAAGAVYYKVRAVDDAGNRGDFSDPVSATRVGTVVAAPAGLTATSKAYDIHLIWTPVSAFDFDHYVVYRADGMGSFEALPVRPDDASADDSDVVPGRLYRYEVSAISTDGEESPLSAPVTGVPAGLGGDGSGDGTLAFLWRNNGRDEPQADWCWDETTGTTFCGIDDNPLHVTDMSVRSRTAAGTISDVCAGDCTTTNTGETALEAPSASPDGDHIAYVKVNEDNQLVVHVARRDGSEDRRLCGGDGAADACLDAWPDTSPQAHACPTPEQCFTLPGTTAGALTPTFSADGDTVYYGGNGLYAVPVSGAGTPQKLMAIAPGERLTNPRATADGERMYFDVTNLGTGGTRSWSVKVDGTDRTPTPLPHIASVPDGASFTGYGPTPGTAYIYTGWGVAPSPDGRHLAFLAAGSLVVADVDGHNAHWVADDQYELPSWTADGSRVVYLDDVDHAIHAVDVATLEDTTLVAPDGDDQPTTVGGQPGSALPAITTPDLAGDGRYVKGDGTVAIRVRATSTTGVRSVGVAIGGQHGTQSAPCSPDCPASFAAEVAVDVSPLTEGAHVAHLVARATAGAEASIARTVIVDRTAPDAPTNVSAISGEDDQVAISWVSGEDPALPDGTAGSAVETEYRTRDGSGPWSDWAPTSEDDVVVGSGTTVEVRSRDAAGNVSEAVSETVEHRSFARTAGSCVIPQPGPTGLLGGGFTLDFEDCSSLDGDRGTFDGGDLLSGRVHIPLVGRDTRKGKLREEADEAEEEEDDCDKEDEQHAVALAASNMFISDEEENEEECDYECDKSILDEIKKTGRDADRYCRKRVWYSIYRIAHKRPGNVFRDENRVVYVGITRNYDRRMCQHQGPKKLYPEIDYSAECLTEVPYFAMALGIEQALIDMYGFANNNNKNLDTPDAKSPDFGAFSNFEPLLNNKYNSISPKYKGLYCAMRVFGQEFLRVREPLVWKGNNNRRWDANFPRRDCSKWWEMRYHEEDAS